MESMNKSAKEELQPLSTLKEQQPLMNILSEYEGVNKGLTALVELYEKEHGTLRLECTSLVEENRRLSLELKSVLESGPESSQAGELANLRQQVTLATQEKDAALELWKLAVGEVSNLEKLLKIFQEQKADSGYSSVNSRLETARALGTAESQLVEARALLARERLVRAELESRLAREQEAHKNTSQHLEASSKRLQIAEEDHTRYLQYQQQEEHQVIALKEAKDELQRALNQNKARLTQALASVEEGRQRVAEALTLVDTACIARDQATSGEAKAQEEVLRLQKALQELTDEAGIRVKKEVEQIKQQCNARIQTLLVDMKKLQEENAEQRSLAARGMRGQKQAEEALEQRTKELRAAQARQPPYESKLASVHAQLADAERRAHMAECSLEAMQLKLTEDRESKRKEESGLEAKAWALEQQVASLSKELEDARRRAQEACEAMTARESQLAAQLQTSEKTSISTIKELHQIVSAHQTISERCQAEMRSMAERFSARLNELRAELVQIKGERDEAQKQLQTMRTKPRSGSSKEAKGRHGGSKEGKVRPKSLFLDC